MTAGADWEPRYRLIPLFLTAVAFIAAAPFYWQRVELDQGEIAEAYENRDLYRFVYPYQAYGFERLRAGEWPLWNPAQNAGVPFAADPRSAILAPASVVFYLFPTHMAMAIHALLSLVLMGTGFALFCRAMGLNYVAGLLGGAVYAFSGASAAAVARPGLANALAAAPFVFWAIREFAARPRWSVAVLGGMAGASGLLSGSGALVAAFMPAALAYAALWSIAPGGDGRGTGYRLAGLMTMALLAVLLSAGQWVPTVLWFRWAHDPWPYLWNFSPAGQMSSTWEALLAQAFSVEPGTTPRVGYIGIVPLLLLPAALTVPSRWRDTAFFLVLAPLATAVALWEPALPLPQFPAKACFYPAVFAVAVLGAVAVQRFLAVGYRRMTPQVAVAAVLVLVASAYLFYVSVPMIRALVVMFICLLVPCLLFRRGWTRASAGVLLAAVVWADLSLASLNRYRHPYEDAPACYRAHGDLIDRAVRAAPHARTALSAGPLDIGLMGNLGMVSGLTVAGGANIPIGKEAVPWWEHLQGEGSGEGSPTRIAADAELPALANFLAVRFVLASATGSLYEGRWDRGGPVLQPVADDGQVRLYRNENAFPRARWVPEWERVDGVEAAIARLTASDFTPLRSAVVEGVGPVSGPSGPEEPGGDANCIIVEDLPERVVLRVTAPRDGLTVLADAFAPGWRATLDGTGVPIHRANGIFRGVVTPPGDHEIVFEYRPLGFFVGMAVSVAALGLLVLLGFAGLFR